MWGESGSVSYFTFLPSPNSRKKSLTALGEGERHDAPTGPLRHSLIVELVRGTIPTVLCNISGLEQRVATIKLLIGDNDFA